MENYPLYILMSILLILLPGPDTGLMMKNTMTLGKRGGYATITGISMALLVHITAAVFGLSAIIVNSAAIFAVLKYVGALYLIYLGVTTLWSIKHAPAASAEVSSVESSKKLSAVSSTTLSATASAASTEESSIESSVVSVEGNNRLHQNKSPLLQGFLTNLLNPKVAVFFLTFLPQFVASGNQSPLPFFLLGITYLVLTIIWFLALVILLNQIGIWIKKPSTQRIIQGISGVILLVFGIRLALERG